LEQLTKLPNAEKAKKEINRDGQDEQDKRKNSLRIQDFRLQI
jgi:hypothetical protein